MAKSGSFKNGIVSNHYRLRVDWAITQSTEKNESYFTPSFYLELDRQWDLYIGTRANTFKVGDTSYSWSSAAVSSAGGGTVKLGTGQKVTIEHDTDGAKTVSVSATFNIQATISGTYYGSITATASLTFDPIPRATMPTLSKTSATMGDKVTITLPRASSAFTHDLAYSFEGGSYVSIGTGVATSKEWTVPTLLSAIKNASSGTFRIRCITKKGSESIGTFVVSLTASVPASAAPTVSATFSDADTNIATKFGAFVQSKTRLKATITAAGVEGATIKSIKSTFGGTVYSGASWTSGTISKAGTHTIKIEVKDSRDQVATITRDIEVLAYEKPKVTEFLVYRVNNAGEADPSGERLYIQYGYSVSAVNNKNTAAAEIKVKQAGASAWTPLKTDTRLAALDYIATPVGTVYSSDYFYDVEVSVTDGLSSEPAERSAQVPSAETILDISEDGTSVSIGEVTQASNTFKVASNKHSIFGGDVTFDGGVLAIKSHNISVNGKMLKAYIANLMYPVGSYYITDDAINPGSDIIFGVGTWERVSERFLLGTSENSKIGTEGGSATVTLTEAQLPPHSHNLEYSTNDGSTWSESTLFGRDGAEASNSAYLGVQNGVKLYSTWKARIKAAGGGQAHDNMPPYRYVCIWRRTA